MSCLSKNCLIWFGGIGASLILAYGSLYLLYSINDKDRFKFGWNNNRREGSPKITKKSSSSSSSSIISETSSSSLIVNIVESDGTEESDSSIEIILVYKQVPNDIFQKNDGFQEIQRQTSTVINEVKPSSSSSTTTSTSSAPITTNLIDRKSMSKIDDDHETVKNRDISIQGYNLNVMRASKMIDQLIYVPLEHYCFELASSKIPLIRGIKGTTIKSLCMKSGAKILIRKDQKINSSNPITTTMLTSKIDIYGTREQIKLAYTLIADLLAQERRSSFDMANFIDDDDDDNPDKNEGGGKDDDTKSDIELIDYPEEVDSEKNQRRTSITAQQLEYMNETLDNYFDSIPNPNLMPPIEVFVSHVVTPQLFYIQITEDKRSVRLDSLHLEMMEFYQNEENQKLCRVLQDQLIENDLVAIQHQSKYYRGYIRKINKKTTDDDDDNLIEIFLADIGIILKYHRQQIPQHLYYLNTNFVTRLPFQAIKCTLFEFRDLDRDWSQKEIDYFRELTREGLWEPVVNVRYHGRLILEQQQDQRSIVEMFLKLPHQSTTINIGRKLLYYKENNNQTKPKVL